MYALFFIVAAQALWIWTLYHWLEQHRRISACRHKRVAVTEYATYLTVHCRECFWQAPLDDLAYRGHRTWMLRSEVRPIRPIPKVECGVVGDEDSPGGQGSPD